MPAPASPSAVTSQNSPQARVDAGNIHVDNVDLHRATRNLTSILTSPHWAVPTEPAEMMELMARVMGYPNMRALYVQGASQEALLKEVKAGATVEPRDYHKRLRIQAEPEPGALLNFPARLPKQFDDKWKSVVTYGLQMAFYRTKPERGDVVVVVGKPGTGKSMLGRTIALEVGGLVIDATLPNWELQLVPLDNGEKPRVVVWDGAEKAENGLTLAAKHIQSKASPTVVLVPDLKELTKLSRALEAAGASPGASFHIMDINSLRSYDALIRREDRERKAANDAQKAPALKVASRRAAP